MSGAIVVAGECCWGSQCKCPSPDMRLFTCTACRSQYHHLCADTGCPQREELDKRTECCNCAPAAAAADIAAVVARPARNRVSTAGNKDRLDAQMEGGDQEQTRVAREAARAQNQGRGQQNLASFFTVPPNKKAAPLPTSATKAAAAAAGDGNNKGKKRGASPVVGQQSMQPSSPESFEVDRLLEMRVVNARCRPVEMESGQKLPTGHSKQYKVRWAGFEAVDDTWELEENINYAAKLGFERGDQAPSADTAGVGDKWLARLPKTMHPSQPGYKQAREAITYNLMAIAVRGQKKHKAASNSPATTNAITSPSATSAHAATSAASATGAASAMAGAAATATSKLSSAEPTVYKVKPNIPQEVELQLVELDKLIETAIRLKRVNLQHLDALGKLQYAEGRRKLTSAYGAAKLSADVKKVYTLDTLASMPMQCKIVPADHTCQPCWRWSSSIQVPRTRTFCQSLRAHGTQ